jgi:DNA-binding Lrp family transcriptional regulator
MRPSFLDGFAHLTPAGDEKWRAECPNCGGRRAISVGAGRDRWLVTCHAGCRASDVVAHAGLRLSALYFEAERLRVGENTPAGQAVPKDPLSSRARKEPEVDGLLASFDAGNITPGELQAVELPAVENVTAPARRVADFYRLVLALRRWADMDDADRVPFAREWVAARLELPPSTVRRAVELLAEAGVIRRVGKLPGRDSRRGTLLWAPGALAEGGVDERGELGVGEAAVEADPPNVELGRPEPAVEPPDVVAVLEAVVVVGDRSASVGGADRDVGTLHTADSATGRGLIGPHAAERFERVHAAQDRGANGGAA